MAAGDLWAIISIPSPESGIQRFIAVCRFVLSLLIQFFIV